MDYHIRGLVDEHEVFVLIDYVQGDVLRFEVFFLQYGDFQGDGITLMDGVTGLDGLIVYLYGPLPDESLQERTGVLLESGGEVFVQAAALVVSSDL